MNDRQADPQTGRVLDRDEARRHELAGGMDAANTAERASRKSDIERLRAARRDPRTERTRPGSLGPQEAAALIGEQVSARQDDPLGAYGYGDQPPIGVMADRVSTLQSALDRTGDEQTVREGPAAVVSPNDVEVIDPRGRLE